MIQSNWFCFSSFPSSLLAALWQRSLLRRLQRLIICVIALVRLAKCVEEVRRENSEERPERRGQSLVKREANRNKMRRRKRLENSFMKWTFPKYTSPWLCSLHKQSIAWGMLFQSSCRINHHTILENHQRQRNSFLALPRLRTNKTRCKHPQSPILFSLESFMFVS